MATTTTATRQPRIDTLPAAQRDAAWALFQDGESLSDAIDAVLSAGDLDAYAAGWDAYAAECLALAYGPQSVEELTPAPAEPEPEPPAPAGGALQRAADKAAWHIGRGLELVYSAGAWLVPSGTRGGVVHRVDRNGCTCEASRGRRVCWHIMAVELVESCRAAA